MVARTGFEPVISALRGRCPWPLDERATPVNVPQFNRHAGESPMPGPDYISVAASRTFSISASAGVDNARPRSVINPARSVGKM